MNNISREELGAVIRELEESCRSFDSSSRCARCVIHLARESLQHGITIDTVSHDESHLPKSQDCFDMDRGIKAYTSLGLLCMKCKEDREACSWCPIDTARALLRLVIADCVDL